MANFIQQRLKRLLNSPYTISEVESQLKRLTTVCANLSEENISHRSQEDRGKTLNLILKSRRDEIISRLRTKSTFEEQKYFFIRCICERDKETQILNLLINTNDDTLRSEMLATRREKDGLLSSIDDSKTLASRNVAFVVAEYTVLTLLLSELYSVDNFQNSELSKASRNLAQWFVSYHSGMDSFSIKRPQQENFLIEIENRVVSDGMKNFLSAIEMGNISGALKIANILMESRA